MQGVWPLFIVAAGGFSIAGAVFDWDFFMNSRRARLFVHLFGRMGARIFYGLLGAALVVVGLASTLGALTR